MAPDPAPDLAPPTADAAPDADAALAHARALGTICALAGRPAGRLAGPTRAQPAVGPKCPPTGPLQAPFGMLKFPRLDAPAMADAPVPLRSKLREAARPGASPPQPRYDHAAGPFAGPRVICSKITPDNAEKKAPLLRRLDEARRAFNEAVPEVPLWPDKPPPRVW